MIFQSELRCASSPVTNIRVFSRVQSRMSDGNVFFLCEATLTSRKFATKWFFSRVSLCMLRKETLMGEALSTWMKLVMKKCFLPCGFESDVTNYVLVKAPEMISLVPDIEIR